MRFVSLSSGSKQNAFYIEDNDTALLIDAGVNGRLLFDFLESREIEPSKIKAILVTHEHNDHVRNLKSLQRRLNIPVAIHPDSRDNLKSYLKNYISLSDGTSLHFGNIRVTPFDVPHDAAHTLGYYFNEGDDSIFLASDIGLWNERHIRIAKNANIIAIEANYDEEMLKHSFYHADLKARISSGHGHLSNNDSMEFLKRVIGEKTSHVCFLHLSENNNNPDRVMRLSEMYLQPYFPLVKFHIASRFEPTEWMDTGVSFAL